MNSKINIMFIIDQFRSGGGTETHLAYLARRLNQSRFRIVIVVFDFFENALTRELEKEGIVIIPLTVGRYYTLDALLKAYQLRKIIKQYHIQIVQTFHFKSDFYGAIVARLSGVKNIISSKRDIGDNKSVLHNILCILVRPIFKNYVAVADAVGEVIKKKEFIPECKIITIYNGVDGDRFCPPDKETKKSVRDEYGVKEGCFVIGMVAWFRPEKNYDILFSAIKEIEKNIADFRIVLVGGGPLLEYFKRYAIQNGLKDYVFFTGPIEDVRTCLKLFDIACLIPGSNEGFSNSILEKMATGIPIIATDVGGNKEAIINGYNGIIITPNDTNALATAILELYKNPSLRNILGQRSRIRALEVFPMEKMIEKHINLYENLIKQ